MDKAAVSPTKKLSGNENSVLNNNTTNKAATNEDIQEPLQSVVLTFAFTKNKIKVVIRRRQHRAQQVLILRLVLAIFCLPQLQQRDVTPNSDSRMRLLRTIQ